MARMTFSLRFVDAACGVPAIAARNFDLYGGTQQNENLNPSHRSSGNTNRENEFQTSNELPCDQKFYFRVNIFLGTNFGIALHYAIFTAKSFS